MKILETFTKKCTNWFGTTTAFILAIAVIAVWFAFAPMYDWSNGWSLSVNLFMTITSYLMLFLIQRSQNKESFAIQLKLNELIASNHGCSNRLINVEDLSEEDIKKLYHRYKRLAEKAKQDEGRTQAHSIEEIDED